MSGTHGEFLRGIRQSVRIRQTSSFVEILRQQQQIFALARPKVVCKCADRSDQERRKHFFEKNFPDDILYMTKIIVMKGGVKHEVNDVH